MKRDHDGEEAPRGLARLVQVVAPDRKTIEALPPAERVLLGAGLLVLSRLERVAQNLDALVAEQRDFVRRGGAVLDLFPPLLGKLAELLDTEIALSRAHLRRARTDAQPETWPHADDTLE